MNSAYEEPWAAVRSVIDGLIVTLVTPLWVVMCILVKTAGPLTA